MARNRSKLQFEWTSSCWWTEPNRKEMANYATAGHLADERLAFPHLNAHVTFEAPDRATQLGWQLVLAMAKTRCNLFKPQHDLARIGIEVESESWSWSWRRRGLTRCWLVESVGILWALGHVRVRDSWAIATTVFWPCIKSIRKNKNGLGLNDERLLCMRIGTVLTIRICSTSGYRKQA